MFILSLLIVLLGWSYLKTYVQIPLKKDNKETIEAEKIFKILSYNVRLFDLYDWHESKNTSGEIFDFINSEDLDIICFQEFLTNNAGELSEKSFQNNLKGKYYSHIHYTIESRNNNYGIATFSKYPIVNRGTINFNSSSNSSIYTDIIVHADTIRVFNNHLQSIRFNKNNYSFISNSKTLKDDERLKEIKDISSRLRDAFVKRANQADILSKHIINSPYPVIVSGDFNDVPVSYTYKTMKQDLKDSFVEAGNGIGTTYMGKFPSFRIDFIFHSDEIKCIDFNIPNVRLSDHYPVTSEFILER